MLGSDLYFRLPVPAQEMVLGVRGAARRMMREGGTFQRELAAAEVSQWWSQDQLQAHQLKQLQALVAHATTQVPYYRDLAAKLQLPPGFPRTLAEFSQFPLISKAQIQAAGRRMLADNAPWLKATARTSGTTGASMLAWRDMHSISRENAFVWRHMQWAGLKAGEPRIWMRGDKVVAPGQTEPPFWRHARADNILMMSAYHLSERTVPAYLQAMEAFDPVVLQAYPSATLMVARYLQGLGRRYAGKRLRSVVTSSETVSDDDRDAVSEAFGVPIFDWYGCMERTNAIANCEHGRYHVLSDYSYVEFIDAGDGTHQVVGTAFGNRTMPLLRYQVGDTVVLPKNPTACPCGRHFPQVERIIGRTDDYLLLPSGRRVYMAVNMLDDVKSILEAQLVQDCPESLRVRVVQMPGAPAIDEDSILRCARAYVGDELKITVDHVQSIARTGNGKLRMVMRTF